MRPLPPPPFRRALVLLTIFLWAVLHLAAALGSESRAGAVMLHPVAVVGLLLAVVILIQIDLSLHREGLILGNLGHSRSDIAILVVSVAGALEVLLQAVGRIVL